ncbi:MAG: hypothetical protein HRT63_11125, partial [Erythrobacter sp.]|nr:hypothetical protein [Erythrobacter sp.]
MRNPARHLLRVLFMTLAYVLPSLVDIGQLLLLLLLSEDDGDSKELNEFEYGGIFGDAGYDHMIIGGSDYFDQTADDSFHSHCAIGLFENAGDVAKDTERLSVGDSEDSPGDSFVGSMGGYSLIGDSLQLIDDALRTHAYSLTLFAYQRLSFVLSTLVAVLTDEV